MSGRWSKVFVTLALASIACGSEGGTAPKGSAATSAKPASSSSAAPSAVASGKASGTASGTASAAPAEPPKPKGDSPGEQLTVDLIPDAPMTGVVKGKPIDKGLTQVFLSESTGKLTIWFSESPPTDSCAYPETKAGIRLEVAKDFHTLGKPFAAAYGSKDPSIAMDKVYSGYASDKGFSSPGFETMGYAIQVDTLEPPPKPGDKGKIKLRAAVLLRVDPETDKDTPSWFWGTFEGPYCSL